jgi:hypothetical protein
MKTLNTALFRSSVPQSQGSGDKEVDGCQNDEYCRLLGETAEKLAVHACALAAEAGRLESIARTKFALQGADLSEK